MFLKAKDFKKFIAQAQELGMTTIGEATELFKTLQAIKAHKGVNNGPNN